MSSLPGRPRREHFGESVLLGRPEPDGALAAELLELAAEQRETVHLGSSDDPAERLAWRAVTVRHADRLAEILSGSGWPAADVVGAEAARAAWLVALHADQRLDLQRRAVTLMSAEVDAGRAPASQLALLSDRMLVNSGQPQRYGTQIAGVTGDVPVPWPCEDPDGLDGRRAAVGLEPWAAYVEAHRAHS
jgi:hypothetical protein